MNPSITYLNNPFELRNMRQAVDKVLSYIKNNKKIAIYSDIDTDGATSTAIMYRYLNNFTNNLEILYHQRKQGHGVRIENVINKDIDLLIIVDSSTNSINECKELSNLGVDILILDHHEFEAVNDYALIINPQLDNYPNKHISGAGICFQFCRAIDEILETDFAINYIDLASVGNIGDMMDVSNIETRSIIYEGLMQIHDKSGNIGILQALKVLKKDYKPNSSDVSFYLTPLLNSTIRLGKIELAIELLICDDENKCNEIAKECKKMNDSRKTLQKGILEEINETIDLSNEFILINATDIKMKSGMNGLIAGNISSQYAKPTLVVTEEDDVMYGSARGTTDVKNFKDIMEDTFLFNMTQGHNQACGVEFDKDRIEEITNALNKTLSSKDLEYVINYDLELEEDDITWDLCYEMKYLSFITGEGFPEPQFKIENLCFDEIKELGKTKEHIKFSKPEFECVKFFNTQEEMEEMTSSTMIDIIASLDVNSWYHFGKKEVIKTKQARIEDIKLYTF